MWESSTLSQPSTLRLNLRAQKVPYLFTQLLAYSTQLLAYSWIWPAARSQAAVKHKPNITVLPRVDFGLVYDKKWWYKMFLESRFRSRVPCKDPKSRYPNFFIPPVFGVRGCFRSVKRRKPLRETFFHLRGSESCGDFFSGLRPLADSVCARTFLYLCPVLKPAHMQDSRTQTNWDRTNAGLTCTNGHSAPDSAVSTHDYAPIVGRILQTCIHTPKM